MKPKIFVSYSRKDEKIFNDLKTFIGNLGVDLIYDKNSVRPSHSIADSLRQHILESDGCLWILSKNSLDSQWCPVEVGAFWGAGKPIYIYNNSDMSLNGNPFSGLSQVRNLEDLKESLKDLKSRGKAIDRLTAQEAKELIEKSVGFAIEGLSAELKSFNKYLEPIEKIVEFYETENTYLQDHEALLSKITDIVEHKPKKLVCAFDVPSFGSVSAPDYYLPCYTAFDRYVSNEDEEWDLTILLLPADVGTKIVETEFDELKKKQKAWSNDIKALKRFQGYAQRAEDMPNGKFKIGWLEVNRDNNGVPLGVHSMPLNVWVSSGEEAVFSTVINNYHSEKAIASDLKTPRETGFSTRNAKMIFFLNQILGKYEENIDRTITLSAQIAASEKYKANIDSLLAETEEEQNKEKNKTSSSKEKKNEDKNDEKNESLSRKSFDSIKGNKNED